MNNASTDGTRGYLEEHGVLAWDEIEYHELDTNTGGDGGFARGMELALASGCECIWTMDDDV